MRQLLMSRLLLRTCIVQSPCPKTLRLRRLRVLHSQLQRRTKHKTVFAHSLGCYIGHTALLLPFSEAKSRSSRDIIFPLRAAFHWGFVL
jgi:hypothetical protein